MNETSELVSQIDGILFEEWEPIGIKHIVGSEKLHSVEDEYSRYAREIVEQYSERVSVDEVCAYLKQVCQKRMGLGRNNTDWSKTEAVAEKIVALLNKKERSET